MTTDLSHYLESALVEVRKKCLGFRQDFKSQDNHHNLNVKRFIYIITVNEDEKSYVHSRRPKTKVYVEERYYRGLGRRGPVDRMESCSESIDHNGQRVCEYTETVDGFWEDVSEEDMSQIDRVEFKLPVSLRTWKHDDNISTKNDYGKIEDKIVVLLAGDFPDLVENRKGATLRTDIAQQLTEFFNQTSTTLTGNGSYMRNAYEAATMKSTVRSHSPGRKSDASSPRSRASSKGSFTIGAEYIPEGVRLSSANDSLANRMHFDYSTRNSRPHSRTSNPYAQIVDSSVTEADKHQHTAAYVASTQRQQSYETAAYAATDVPPAPSFRPPSRGRSADARIETSASASNHWHHEKQPSDEHIYEEITEIHRVDSSANSRRVNQHQHHERSSSNSSSGVVKAAYDMLETLKKDYGIGNGVDGANGGQTSHAEVHQSERRENHYDTASETVHTQQQHHRHHSPVIGDTHQASDSEWKVESGEMTYTVNTSRSNELAPKSAPFKSGRSRSTGRIDERLREHNHGSNRSLASQHSSSSQDTIIEKTVVTEHIGHGVTGEDHITQRATLNGAAVRINRNPSCDNNHKRYEEFRVTTPHGPVIVKRYSDGCITPLLNFHDWSVEELHFDYYKELNYDGIKPDPHYYQPYEEQEHIYEEIREVTAVTEVHETLRHTEHEHTPWEPIHHAVPAVVRTPTPPPVKSPSPPPLPPPLPPSPPPIVYESLYRTHDLKFTRYIAERPPTPPPPPRTPTPPPQKPPTPEPPPAKPVDVYEPSRKGFVDFPEPEEYVPPVRVRPSHDIVPRRVKEMEDEIHERERLDAERNKKPVPKRVWQRPKSIAIENEDHIKHTSTEPIGPAYYHELVYQKGVLRQMAAEHHIIDKHKPTSVPASRATSRPSTPNPHTRRGSIPRLDEFDFPFDHVQSRRFSPSPTRSPIGGGVMSTDEDYRRAIEAHTKINGHSQQDDEAVERTGHTHRQLHQDEQLLIDFSDENAELESAYTKRAIREMSRHNRWSEDHRDLQAPRSPIDRRTDLESIIPANSPFVNVKRRQSPVNAVLSPQPLSPAPHKHSHAHGHGHSHIHDHSYNSYTTENMEYHSNSTNTHSHQHVDSYLGAIDHPEPLQSAYQKEEIVTKQGIVKQLAERFEMAEEHEPDQKRPPQPPPHRIPNLTSGYDAYSSTHVEIGRTEAHSGHSHVHVHSQPYQQQPAELPQAPMPPSPIPARRHSQKKETHASHTLNGHSHHQHELPPATIDFGTDDIEILKRSKEILELNETIGGGSRVRTVHRTTHT